MKTTLQLAGIIFFGAIMGLEAYTKLAGEKPAAVAFNIQEVPRPDRPTEKPAVLPTGQAENVSVPLLLAIKEARTKRQGLLQADSQYKAGAAAKVVKNPVVPVSPTTVAPQEREQTVALPEATPVAPSTESLLASQTAPTSKDSTATAPKKKRKFLGIFPIRHKG
jgi:hypothetical protein